MQKSNYFRLMLLLILVFPVVSVLSQNEIIIYHSDYFSESVVTPEQLQVSISGLPDDDRIQIQLGGRKLISNTPVSITKIDNTSCLLQTQLEYEVSSNLFTFYTYKDAYPQSFQKNNNSIEWLYLRTCTDWNHANGWWFDWRPVTDYHLYVSYSSIELGTMRKLGFQGYLTYNFSLSSQQIPKYIVFNDLQVSLNTTNFYSVLTSAVIANSSIQPIGEYTEYYNEDSKVQLGSVAVSPFSYDSSIEGDYDISDAISSLNLYIDPSQPVYKETPYDSQQVRLASTPGQDLALTGMKNYISIQPDIHINKQNIIGRTISTPNSLDIDTESGAYFNPAGIVNQPFVQQISVPRIVSAYVQNFNFRTTYRLKFMVYSTLEVKSLNGTTIELGTPLLNIGDRYIDLSFKGITGADITYGQEENFLTGLTKFFNDLFSSIWGILIFILITIALVGIIYVLIRRLPAILKRVSRDKPKQIS